MAKFVKASDKDSTAMSELIDNVTTRDSENLISFVKISDLINSSADGPKEAVKCIKKRLATKTPSVVKTTLLLLDSCVKECGMKFHIQIFNRDFLEVFLKIIKPKNNPTMEIQTSVLSLIQKWAISFQGIPELKEICKTYESFLNKNIDFPPRDPDQVSQIYVMSTGNPNSLLAPQVADRRDSSRSIVFMEPETCTVYEVDPQGATLNPAGSARRRGNSVEPKFPHLNTLNPCGRSPSRDRNPAPGGMRRASYAPTLGDGDLRVAGRRKQSYVIIPNDPVYGGDRKQSYVGNSVLQLGLPGQDRKKSYTGSSGLQMPAGYGQERKQSSGNSAAAELHSEMISIRQTCKYFSELLSSVKPGKESATDKELLQEFNLTCMDMKKRVAQLLETPEGEKVSEELLTLNDELNISLFQYQKYRRPSVLMAHSEIKAKLEPVTIKVNDGDISN